MNLGPDRRDEIEHEHQEHYDWNMVGRPAGVYWLGGESVIVSHDSRAEARLLQQGAILIATLRFDADPLEAGHSGRTITRIPAHRASSEFFISDVN
jgi:hypothetical protein